jgi:large subunit ribosomal protein L31
VYQVKKDIHPVYFPNGRIVCSCGAVHDIGSTKKDQKIEICAKCHPFYTGTRRIVDTAGRVERFIRKYNWGQQPAEEEKKGPKPKTKKGAEEALKILKEMEGEPKKA